MPTYIDHTKNIKELFPEIRLGDFCLVPKGTACHTLSGGKSTVKHDSPVIITSKSDSCYWFIYDRIQYSVSKFEVQPYKQEHIVFYHNRKRYKVSADLYYKSAMGIEKSFSSNKNHFVAFSFDPVFELDGKKYYVTEWKGINEIQIGKYEIDTDGGGEVYVAERFPKPKPKKVTDFNSIKSYVLGELRWKHQNEFRDKDITEEQMDIRLEKITDVLTEVLEEYKADPYGKNRAKV